MALFRYDKTSNKLVPITSEGSVGIQVGAVMAFAKGTTNENWLLCDGRDTTGTAEELQTHYPALYAYLGGSNVLPDYRECVLVGVGQNTTDTIAEHDPYTLGEFKDDQFQQWTASYNNVNNIPSCTGIASYKQDGSEEPAHTSASGGRITLDPSPTTRTGTTTHGKQKGVAFYIKATSAGIEVDKDLYGTKEYIRDQNILSKWEDITIPAESHTITMQYDGELYFTTGAPGATGGEYVYLYVNGFPFIVGVQPKGGDGNNVSTFIPFTKGDIMYTNKSGHAKVRYYKLRDYTGR